jgi:hypothetical protein
MSQWCISAILCFAAATASAAPGTTVVDWYNAIHKDHPIAHGKIGTTPVTIDLARGYLTFVDGGTTVAMAMWVVDKTDWFVGETRNGAIQYWECDRSSGCEEVQDPPFREYAIDDLLMPGADAKLAAAHAALFPPIRPTYELPRKGTTLVEHFDLASLKAAIQRSNAPAATKRKLVELVETQVYNCNDRAFKGRGGKFDEGVMSKR